MKALRPILGIVLLLMTARAPVFPAEPDYRESFRRGIQAIDRKDWAEATRWLKQAAAGQSKEGGDVKIYGVRFEPYLPHYYLGLALSRQGDCAGALAQWRESEQQGAVQRSSRYEALKRGLEGCKATVDSTVLAQTQKEIEKEASKIEPQPSPASPASPAPPAATPKNEVTEPIPQTPAPSKPDDQARVEEQAALEPETEATPGKEVPPAELLAAARALFRADYPKVVTTLASARLSDHRSQVAMHLLLAAARYALFLEGGEKEEALHRQALENVRACRRLDPRLAPDPKIFSPRFTAFFDAAGRTGG